MGTTSSTTMQRLGEVEQCALAVGLFTGRIAAKWQLSLLNLLTGQKSIFSPRRGDSLNRSIWNLAQTRGTGVQNFTLIGSRGWEHSPQNCKNFHFLVKRRPTGGNSLTDFYNCRAFMRPTILHNIFNLTWFTSPVTELLVRNRASLIYPESFRAPCRCENMVFVCFYFCYWKDCSKCKLPVLNLLTGQKSGFSPRRATHSTDSLLTWHDRRAPGSAWLCKISPRCRDGNPAPKYQKFPLLVKDRPIANLFTDF